MSQLDAAAKILDTITGSLDDNLESAEERQKELTRRQEIDSTSPYKLPHFVRPIITLTLLFFQLLILVAMFFEVKVPEHVVYEVGALNAVAIGFYFNSRKAEKINAKKVGLAMQIEKDKAKLENKKERVELRREIRNERKQRRENKS